MALTANGTTFAFGTTNLGTVASISREDTGAEIDVTGLADTEKTYEAGQLDSKLTVTCYGAPADVYGDIAAITIVYSSGGSESVGTYVCTGVSDSSEKDAPTTTTYKFARAASGS
jgi:membrane-associated protease RseP (regulator of RpoE activity)